jgi:hypothetical protein
MTIVAGDFFMWCGLVSKGKGQVGRGSPKLATAVLSPPKEVSYRSDAGLIRPSIKECRKIVEIVIIP